MIKMRFLSHNSCSSLIKSITTISIIALFLLQLLSICQHVDASSEKLGDPYKILGVDRHASLQDIRRSYKQLAKEWHPDKSDNPDAERKFVEIKQAYELLSDSERRKAYDSHGITNEDAKLYRDQHDYSQYGRFAFDPFDDFFGSHRFTFHDQDISLFHKLLITAKYYETQVIPKSHTTPHILFFYADWCFSCMKAASTFKKLLDSLEPLGVTFATINAGLENQLVRRIGVHSLPCISLVLDGHNYLYKEPVISIPKIVDFVRLKLPYKLLGNIKDSNVDAFLSGWTDNRVRALVMEPRSQPRLRYLIAAYHFRHLVAFGFVQLNSPDTKEIQHRYKVNPSLDSAHVFNEDPSKPVASVQMSDISSETLNLVIKVNRYLALPRLSSQEMLDGICPAEWNRPRKRLCVILVTENTESHDRARETIRRIALQSSYSTERVRFAYIYQNKQLDFINSLSAHGRPDDTLLRIVVIWRRDMRHVKYEWIHETDLHVNDYQALDNETYEGVVNKTKQKIDNVIQTLLRPSEALSYEAEVKDLLDEHAQGLLFRIVTKLYTSLEYFVDNLGSEHIWPALSVVATILFILGVGYLMSYLVRMEEDNVKRNENKDQLNNNAPRDNYVQELKLHELRAEKYNGLVRLLKPGCRTIVLITDLQSRPKLIPAYHRAVWPYRKNKTLMFSHMLIEKGLAWYSELLRLSLSELRDIQINPRNCIGTVIALNGHRKYFCMYHAKHPESSRGAKRMIKMTRHLSASPADPEAGAFLGMDSDDSDVSTDVSEPKILLEENLLDGLSNWLDRLFEGTTHRYYINYWPDFTTK